MIRQTSENWEVSPAAPVNATASIAHPEGIIAPRVQHPLLIVRGQHLSVLLSHPFHVSSLLTRFMSLRCQLEELIARDRSHFLLQSKGGLAEVLSGPSCSIEGRASTLKDRDESDLGPAGATNVVCHLCLWSPAVSAPDSSPGKRHTDCCQSGHIPSISSNGRAWWAEVLLLVQPPCPHPLRRGCRNCHQRRSRPCPQEGCKTREGFRAVK